MNPSSSSSYLGGGGGGFQAPPNQQLAQLQMQNYGLQGIVNPLLAGSQAPTAAVPTVTGFGTGQNGCLGTGQAMSFPPGFVPPGLAQNAPATTCREFNL